MAAFSLGAIEGLETEVAAASQVDTTLTVSGKAADAKTTGDQLGNIKNVIAPTFQTNTAYDAGTYVWVNQELYRFTVHHNAGNWTGTDAERVILENELAGIKSTVKSMNNTGISVAYLDGSSRNIEIDSGGTDFDGGYVDDNNQLHITLNGEDIDGFTPFTLPAGGGGGGAAAGNVTITRVTDAAIACVHGDPVTIQFTFAATDSGGDTLLL